MIEANVIYVLVVREFKKFLRSKGRLFSTMARPVLWLFIVGGGMSRFVTVSRGVDYMQFIFPGIIGMTILFSAFFSSISIIWDKEFGMMKEILVAPASRLSIVLGKSLSGTAIALIQTVIILMLFPVLGMSLGFWSIIGALAVATLLAFCIAALGLVISTFFESLDSFNVIMNFIVMPMFFLSGAMYPVNKLPVALKVLSKLNPLTYGVDALKHTILTGKEVMDFSIITDLFVLTILSIIFVVLGSILFERKS